MIRNVLTHIGGVDAYGVAAILLFFACFLGLLVWAFRLKRPHLEAMGRMPLEDAPPAASPTTTTSNNDSRHE